MVRLLHVLSQAPDFTGSGKFIQQIILQARKRGYDNFLVAGVAGDFQMDPAVLPRERCVFVRFDGEDLPFPIAGMSDAMPYPSTRFSTLSDVQVADYRAAFRKKINEALERFQPDLIHSHHLWMVSALTRRLASDLPMVTTCHGTCLRQHRLCPNIGPGLVPDLTGIDAVMALNPTQRQEICGLLSLPPEAVPVMAGGYDETLFYGQPKSFSGRAEMVYAGKLCRAKGVPWLLKSLERIRDLPFRLHIAGSGSGEEQQACFDLGHRLGDRVTFHGPLSHPDLAGLMRRCHLFVLPSFFEGVPLVLMEALACGCRLISTDLPGVREILAPVSDDMVGLVPLPPLKNIDTPHSADEPMLEKRLASVLEPAIRRIADQPEPDWSFVREKTRSHTWEKVFARIESVYRDVAGTPC